MKTVEEWLVDGVPTWPKENTVDFIRAIQADARESALKEAAALSSHWGEETVSEQILSLIPGQSPPAFTDGNEK
jgi:hypothetical protein